MTNNDIITCMNTILKSLCNDLNESRYKSLQTIFTLHNQALKDAKKLFTWKQITIFINNSCSMNLTVNTCRTMYDRGKQHKKSTNKSKSLSMPNNEKPKLKKDVPERDQLGRLAYPEKQVTEEGLKVWDEFKIPRSAKAMLTRHGISKEEFRSLNITAIDPSTIADRVSDYCKKKVEEWDKINNAHLYRK